MNKGFRAKDLLSVPYLGLILTLVSLILFFSATSQHFWQLATVRTIANQLPELTFLSIGMTFVLVIGGIDLSVGSLMALAAAIIGVLMVQLSMPLWLAVLAAGIVVAGCGLLTGSVTHAFKIPSFIVTLGVLEIARGLTKLITGSKSIYIGGPVEYFGEPIRLVGVSPAFLTAVLMVLAGQFVLQRTTFGRYCVAIGNNAQVVRMSGISAWPYTIATFALSGLMCALAAWAQLGRMPTADPNTAVGIELSAIAACVIGGTSLLGGRGSVIGTFLGVIIIQLLQTGLAQLGISDANKQMITGVVIIVAVAIDAWRNWSPEKQ